MRQDTPTLLRHNGIMPTSPLNVDANGDVNGVDDHTNEDAAASTSADSNASARVVDEDLCRVCRGPAEEDPYRPLYYPCRCRGSIRYVHSDCLLDWLSHRGGEKRCELCGTMFAIHTEYADSDQPFVVRWCKNLSLLVIVSCMFCWTVAAAVFNLVAWLVATPYLFGLQLQWLTLGQSPLDIEWSLWTAMGIEASGTVFAMIVIVILCLLSGAEVGVADMDAELNDDELIRAALAAAAVNAENHEAANDARDEQAPELEMLPIHERDENDDDEQERADAADRADADAADNADRAEARRGLVAAVVNALNNGERIATDSEDEQQDEEDSDELGLAAHNEANHAEQDAMPADANDDVPDAADGDDDVRVVDQHQVQPPFILNILATVFDFALQMEVDDDGEGERWMLRFDEEFVQSQLWAVFYVTILRCCVVQLFAFIIIVLAYNVPLYVGSTLVSYTFDAAVWPTLTSSTAAHLFIGLAHYVVAYIIREGYHLAHCEVCRRERLPSSTTRMNRSVKVTTVLGIELLVLPTIEGALLDYALTELTGGNLQTLLGLNVLTQSWHPFLLLLIRWIQGISCLMPLSMCIMGLRSMTRPGLLWFTRDPDEVDLQRDIVQKSMAAHLRRWARSMVMFDLLMMIVLCVPAYLVAHHLHTVGFVWRHVPVWLAERRGGGADWFFIVFIAVDACRSVDWSKLLSRLSIAWMRGVGSVLGLYDYLLKGSGNAANERPIDRSTEKTVEFERPRFFYVRVGMLLLLMVATLILLCLSAMVLPVLVGRVLVLLSNVLGHAPRYVYVQLLRLMNVTPLFNYKLDAVTGSSSWLYAALSAIRRDDLRAWWIGCTPIMLLLSAYARGNLGRVLSDDVPKMAGVFLLIWCSKTAPTNFTASPLMASDSDTLVLMYPLVWFVWFASRYTDLLRPGPHMAARWHAFHTTQISVPFLVAYVIMPTLQPDADAHKHYEWSAITATAALLVPVFVACGALGGRVLHYLWSQAQEVIDKTRTARQELMNFEEGEQQQS